MRLDNTRCTSGLVFMGSRPLDLPHLANRLDRVLKGRGFSPGPAEMQAPDHLRMPLGAFDLHLNTLENPAKTDQGAAAKTVDQVMDAVQRKAGSDLSVAEGTLTLTVTIVKLPSDLPSLREAERSTVTAHAALALATLELAQALDPDYVQWLQPDMMLQTSSFLSVLEKVTPRRVSSAERAAERRRRPNPVLPLAQTAATPVSRLFPDIEDTAARIESQTRVEMHPASHLSEDSANQRYLRAVFRREDEMEPPAALAPEPGLPASDEPSTVSRLATWAVSVLVSLISLPIGLALMVYNLLRGEDLRLALTALALTGLFSGMVALGLMERAVATIAAMPVIGDMLTRLPI